MTPGKWLLACQGQVRLAPSGHVPRIDMDAALGLAATRGHNLAALSELLPAAEAGLVEAIQLCTLAVPSWPRFAAAAPDVSVSDQDYVPIAPSRLVPEHPIDPRSGDDDWMPTDERMRAMVAADPTRTDDADFVAPPADRFAAGR